MHSSDVHLKRIGLDLPEMARPSEWIQNGRMIIECGKVIRRRMVATMFRTWNDKVYLKVEAGEDTPDSAVKLHPGMYFHIPKSAHLTDFKFVALKPGMHDIWSIIRLCRCRVLLGQDKKTWRMRRKMLTAIAELYNWLDIGVYEIVVAKQSQPNIPEGPVLKARVRQPDFAGGTITDAEQQMLRRHLNNWVRRARRTEPAAPELLIPAINNLYASFGLKAPRIVIARSPLVVAIAGSFAAAICFARKNPGADADWSREAFEAVASDEIYEATVRTAFRAIEDSIDQNTLKVFEGLLNEAGGAATSRSMSGAAPAAIENALADAAEATLVSVIRGQSRQFEKTIDDAVFQATRQASGTDSEGFLASPVQKYRGVGTMFEQLAEDLCGGRDNVRDLMLSCLSDCRKLLKIGNLQQYDECLTTALKEVFGLHLAAHQHNLAWQNVVTKCGAILLHEEFCIVSEFPEVLNVDEQGRPHCEDGPSYVWKDGWTLYHWHGIRVTRQIIEKMDTITVNDIKQEPNLEVRRLMLERYGSKRFLIDSGAKEIHRDHCGVLYSQMVHPALEPIVMVKVVNSTPEPDGSFKDYFLRVPSYIRTATAAVAWTFGVAHDQYRPLVQT